MRTARIAWWGILVCLLAGCSLVQERERRFMPEPTIPATVEQTFVADCNAAIASKDVPRLVESCSALSAVRCGSWMDRNILAEHGIVMTDGTATAVGAASTIAAGAFALSPGAVAGVGAAQMLLHLAGQVEKTGLGAPEGFTAQSVMLATQATCSNALLAASKVADFGFAQAVIGIDRCRRFCSPGAASAITTQALTGIEVEAAPSGRLTIKRIAQ